MRSGNAGSYGNSIFIFLMKLCTLFHGGYTRLNSHQYCGSVLFSPHPHENLLFLGFLMIDILTCMRRYFIVVLTYISLIISDVDQQIIIYIPFSHLYLIWKIYILVFCPFLIFFCWVCFLYILAVNPLFNCGFQICTPIYRLPFYFAAHFFCSSEPFQFDAAPLVYIFTLLLMW